MKDSLLLLFLAPGVLLADTVNLKGGGRLSGRIVEQSAEKVLVDVGDGIVGVSMDRVEKVVKGPSTLDDYDARASKLGQQDLDGWRALAQWASTKGLSLQSRTAYQRVLAIAPDDAEARRALGFVQVAGRWLTEEESYRARGFVKYDGEWMTPAEVQLAESTAAREQADIDGPLVDWKKKGSRIELIGREAVEDREAYKLKITLKSGGVLTAYLDVKSANLVRTEGLRHVRGKQVQVETTFGDYRLTEGILFPHLVEVRATGRPHVVRIVVDRVEVNPVLSDALFVPPA